jgi:actin related protein 2/3 complex subunit 5
VSQEAHLHTVLEVLQSIKASEMTPMLQRIYQSEGGSELLDVLVKYLYVIHCDPRRLNVPDCEHRYKGMSASPSSNGPRTPSRANNLTPQATGFSQVSGRPGAANESTGAAMSVLLSWHEKVVDVAGIGSIGRCMTDWRKV